jgi:hypothetical protein
VGCASRGYNQSEGAEDQSALSRSLSKAELSGECGTEGFKREIIEGKDGRAVLVCASKKTVLGPFTEHIVDSCLEAAKKANSVPDACLKLKELPRGLFVALINAVPIENFTLISGMTDTQKQKLRKSAKKRGVEGSSYCMPGATLTPWDLDENYYLCKAMEAGDEIRYYGPFPKELVRTCQAHEALPKPECSTRIMRYTDGYLSLLKKSMDNGAAKPGKKNPKTVSFHTGFGALPRLLKPEALWAQARTMGLAKPREFTLVSRANWHSHSRYKDSYNNQTTYKRIIIHHTAGPVQIGERSPEQLEQLCLDKVLGVQRGHHSADYGATGYHFMICPNGTIYEGRPLFHENGMGDRGAHTRHHNEHSIGISFLGMYDPASETPNLPLDALTPESVDGAARLIAWLSAKTGIDATNDDSRNDFPHPLLRAVTGELELDPGRGLPAITNHRYAGVVTPLQIGSGRNKGPSFTACPGSYIHEALFVKEGTAMGRGWQKIVDGTDVYRKLNPLFLEAIQNYKRMGIEPKVL